ncbi:type I 3-dehydroquinate dehydratase [Methanocaldococcus indicus]|uniref:type I 3-dehydroquinate dehydratase n=1 Tax=Methanocaldococcus indicus TaxID=213231 RepID=UPI003C6D4464
MICLPVIEKDKESALKTAEKYLELADLVEFRLDYLKELKIEDIKDFCRYPSIITIRSKEQGGYFEGNKTGYLIEAIRNNAKFVDVENDYVDLPILVDYKKKIDSKTKIIVSYHNFEETPEKEKLKEIINNALSFGDIAKIATKVNDKKDILTILELSYEYKGKIIAIGMGEEGKLTRILAPYFGSILTFSSYKGKSSAPGQIDIEKMKKIIEMLELKK